MINEHGHRVVFLDRDGTINVDHGYVHRIEDFEFIPGAIDAMKAFQQAGFRLAIVTNQSGVAAGMYENDDVLRLHDWMQNELAKCDVVIDGIAFCPHTNTSQCECRKPNPGLAFQIESELGPIEFQESWMIGDKLSDVEFAYRLGMEACLIESQYWQSNTCHELETQICESLLACVQHVVDGRSCFP